MSGRSHPTVPMVPNGPPLANVDPETSLDITDGHHTDLEADQIDKVAAPDITATIPEEPRRSI